MFALTRKTDYALVALTALARPAGEPASARALADKLNLPGPALRNILKSLAAANLLRSTQGPFGGYTLAQPASQITIEAVVEAIEGPLALTPCCSDVFDADACKREDSCLIKDAVRDLHQRLRRYLTETTIDDLQRASLQEPKTGVSAQLTTSRP